MIVLLLLRYLAQLIASKQHYDFFPTTLLISQSVLETVSCMVSAFKVISDICKGISGIRCMLLTAVIEETIQDLKNVTQYYALILVA